MKNKIVLIITLLLFGIASISDAKQSKGGIVCYGDKSVICAVQSGPAWFWVYYGEDSIFYL